MILVQIIMLKNMENSEINPLNEYNSNKKKNYYVKATTTTTTTTEAELAGPPVLNLAPVRTRPGGSRFSSRPDIFSVRRPSPRIRPPVPTGVASASPPSDDGADKPLSVRHLAAISRTNTHRVPSSGRFWN